MSRFLPYLKIWFVVTLTFIQVGCAPGIPQYDDQQGKELVVLLHGLGRNQRSMVYMAAHLRSAGYATYRVDYRSLGERPEDVLAHVAAQINGLDLTRRPKVHFVGHSLGGLLTRAYLEQNRPDNLGRVVLLGTPNHGTEIIDKYAAKCWLSWLGPTALSLGTGPQSLPNSLPIPGYPVGVVAGLSNGPFSGETLPGDDDGLVTVESSKVEGMRDFIVVNTNHAFLRLDTVVMEQTVNFLRKGEFVH